MQFLTHLQRQLRQIACSRRFISNFNRLNMPKTVQSKFEYVRDYEAASDAVLLPDSFLVVRVDGKNFHSFSDKHRFRKPNDKRALDLMTRAARSVMSEFAPHIIISYGQSDEYSFIMRRDMSLYSRRASKIVSTIASQFSSAYVFHWNHFFSADSNGDAVPLLYPPTFDARVVTYPSEDLVRDYLKWRQVDCHVNNLYNTTYHALTGEYTRYELNQEASDETSSSYRIQSFEMMVKERVLSGAIATAPGPPLTGAQATHRLSGSVKGDKNEILFRDYGINYNNELNQFRKGSLLLLRLETLDEPNNKMKVEKLKKKRNEDFVAKHQIVDFVVENIIDDKFWQENEWIFKQCK